MLVLSRSLKGDKMRITNHINACIKSIYNVVAKGLMTIMSHIVGIESQSQSTPPSPTRPQSTLDSLPLMFLDNDRKYPEVYNPTPRLGKILYSYKFHSMPLIKNPGGVIYNVQVF